jgi:hypothetical protein
MLSHPFCFISHRVRSWPRSKLFEVVQHVALSILTNYNNGASQTVIALPRSECQSADSTSIGWREQLSL